MDHGDDQFQLAERLSAREQLVVPALAERLLPVKVK